MNRLIALLPLLAAIGLAQDSGLYINRIELLPSSNAKNYYTYFTADSYQPEQPAQYTTKHAAMASLYEDDLTAEATTCKTTECPKLVKILAYVKKSGATIETTRLGAVRVPNEENEFPLGFVAPYPGYCGSNDAVPIVELYSYASKDQKYVYWTPLVGNAFVAANFKAKSYADYQIFNAPKLIGYGLETDSTRLVLENAAPDFVKPTGKANFTHSPIVASEIVLYTVANKQVSLTGPTFLAKMNSVGATFARPTGIFLLGTNTAAITQSINDKCGDFQKIAVYCKSRTELENCRLGTVAAMSAMTPLEAVSMTASTFKTNDAKSQKCGGYSGLAKLREFQKGDVYQFAVTDEQIIAVKAEGFTETAADLGYVPKDSFGFFLFSLTL